MSNSPRKELSRWVQGRIDEDGRVDVQALVSDAIGAFCGDGEWVRRWVEESMRSMIAEEIWRTVREARHTVSSPNGGRSLKDPIGIWDRWTEHDPDTGRYVVLREMTAGQVLSVARVRRDRGEREVRHASWLEAVGEKTKRRRAARVGDAWNDGELLEAARRFGVVADERPVAVEAEAAD